MKRKQEQIIELQRKQIDTLHLLNDASVKIIRLQDQLRESQAAMYNEISGGRFWEKTFITSVVMDEGTHFPVYLFRRFDYNDPRTRVCERQSLLEEYSKPNSVMGSNPPVNIVPPASGDETVSFVLELLEYKFLKDIDNMGKRVDRIDFTKEESRSSYSQPFPLSEYYHLIGKELDKLLSQNRFANDIMEKSMRGFGMFRLPEGTVVQLKYNSKSKSDNESRTIVFYKPGFFHLSFHLEPQFISGYGRMPAALSDTTAIVRRSRAYFIRVIVQAKFANNPTALASELKKWALWLTDRLITINQDD